MFLIRLPVDHPVQWLFVHDDPRAEGCLHPIQEYVDFEDEADAVTSAEHSIDGAVLGRTSDKPPRYKRFLRRADALDAGYEPLNGAALLLSSWSRYAGSEPIRGGGISRFATAAAAT